MFNQLKPRPEHLQGVIDVLSSHEALTPHEIVKRTGLSLTATLGAIEELERRKSIDVLRQTKTPKMKVRLTVRD